MLVCIVLRLGALRHPFKNHDQSQMILPFFNLYDRFYHLLVAILIRKIMHKVISIEFKVLSGNNRNGQLWVILSLKYQIFFSIYKRFYHQIAWNVKDLLEILFFLVVKNEKLLFLHVEIISIERHDFILIINSHKLVLIFREPIHPIYWSCINWVINYKNFFLKYQ